MNAVKPGKVTVTDTITGEIRDFEYTTVADLKDRWLEIDALAKAVDRAQKKLKAELEFALGDDEVIDFPDGYKLKRQYRTTYTYDKGVVANYLDEDALDVVTKIDGTALKALVKEMVDRGDIMPGAWKDIESSATGKTSSFVQVVKK